MREKGAIFPSNTVLVGAAVLLTLCGTGCQANRRPPGAALIAEVESIQPGTPFMAGILISCAWGLWKVWKPSKTTIRIANSSTCLEIVFGDIFEQSDDHAGEMETSLALAYHPELVARNPDGSLTADEGRTAASRFAAR